MSRPRPGAPFEELAWDYKNKLCYEYQDRAGTGFNFRVIPSLVIEFPKFLPNLALEYFPNLQSYKGKIPGLMRGKEKFKLSTKPSLLVPHEYSGSWKFKLCRLYGCKQHNSAHFGYVSGEGVAQKYSQIKEKGLDRQDQLLPCA